MPSKIVKECVAALVRQNLRIAFAESATAGRFASELALVPKSGFVLMGGIVCYDAGVKTSLLNVPESLICDHTAESAEVTRALAENLRTQFDAEVLVAITGLASPGGSETDSKPVGTMFLHIILPETAISHTEIFNGSQEEIILQAIDKGCELIVKKLHS